MPSVKDNFLLMLEEMQHPDYDDVGEQRILDFVKSRPELVTGSDFVSPRIVIPEFTIGGQRADFFYIKSESGRTHICLVEFEDVRKPIFRKDDGFSSEFNQALQQVEDWRQHVGNHSQVLQNLYNCFAPSGMPVTYFPAFSYRGILVMGRRSEVNNINRHKRWGLKKETMERSNTLLMTYDGFIERSNFFFSKNEAEANSIPGFRYSEARNVLDAL